MPKLRLVAMIAALVLPMAARAEPVTSPAGDPEIEIEVDCEAEPTCLAAKFADAITGQLVESDALRLASLVTFKPGRVRVYSKDREKLIALARAWRAHVRWSRITIEGFDGAPGNLALAQHRADKIRGYLIRYGVPAAYVVAIGRAQPRDGSVDPHLVGRTDLTIAFCDRQADACRVTGSASAVSALE